MDVLCEGCLLTPPDRGTIIGRAVWKPRYVILGPQNRPEPVLPRSTSSSRLSRKGLKTPCSKRSMDNLAQPASNQLWLSIYKAKDEFEVIAQYPLSSIKTCEIQSVQYKKPGPSVPTLVMTFEPDSATEKNRRRRSSRTSGLSSHTWNAFPNSLLFRTVPEERLNIYDWQISIQAKLPSNSNDYEPPMPPDSPAFTSFINPFSPRSPTFDQSSIFTQRPDSHQRVMSSSFGPLQGVPNRERGQTSTLISPSPSLRSKSSNISSHASSFGRPQNYRDMLPIQQLPADLPSPASTVGFDDQSILGWTSAQGRSSALSSHTRGSTSIGTAGTPPGPRETILDRAFMMRCIPGSDKLPAAEDDGGKLSSIARFEALMKEADERIKAKAIESKNHSRKNSTTGWELDEDDEDDDSDEDSDIEGPARRTRLIHYDEQIHLEDDDLDPLSLSVHNIPTPAQRALEYISGRNTPATLYHRRPLSPPPQPPTQLPRSLTTPPRVQRRERPKSLAIYSSSMSPEKYDEARNYTTAPASSTANARNRSSSNSTKRLSFTEFTRRLSSTSSLLLVQTNASSSSDVASSRNSHQSSEASFIEPDDTLVMHRGLSQSRISGTSGMGTRSCGMGEMDAAKRCGWRGSGFGVIGGEGGFL